jgi:prevent-host-death family protein
MVRVSSAEFQKNVGRYNDIALTQPVTVTRNGRDRTVVISAEEYQRLKRRAREVLTLDDLGEEDLALVRATKPSPAAVRYDGELK